MNDAERTPKLRRGFATPLLTGLVTVAAAAVVVIGLGLIDGNLVGSDATPSNSSSALPEPTESPDASAPHGPAASSTSAVTIGVGEYGPIHSMASDDAFANGQTCEVRDAIVNAKPTDIGWTVAFPEGWSTNGENTDLRSACTLFGPEPFEAPDDQAIPETVAIATDVPPGGDFAPDGASVTTEEYTVDGAAAVRYEIDPGDGGFVSRSTVVWMIAIAGNLPGVGNDQPYLAFQTSSDDPDELAARTAVLDRMVATLDIDA